MDRARRALSLRNPTPSRTATSTALVAVRRVTGWYSDPRDPGPPSQVVGELACRSWWTARVVLSLCWGGDATDDDADDERCEEQDHSTFSASSALTISMTAASRGNASVSAVSSGTQPTSENSRLSATGEPATTVAAKNTTCLYRALPIG